MKYQTHEYNYQLQHHGKNIENKIDSIINDGTKSLHVKTSGEEMEGV